MNTKIGISSGAASAAAAISQVSADHDPASELIAKIKSKDDQIRGPAWQNAEMVGAPAVKALASLFLDPDFETGRAAKRALWRIVRHVGRPGADGEREAVVKELISILKDAANPVRREILGMLSEIGGEESVPAVAEFLNDREIREAARAALERTPGSRAVEALKEGMAAVDPEFKYAMAQSLRVRGVQVDGYASQKLVPTRPTGTASKTL